jgi:hypothetical protein
VNGGSADPYGLRITQSALTLAADADGGAAFFGAARDVVGRTMSSLDAKATAVVDVGVVGTFGRTGLTLANGYIAAADMGYQFWNGDLSAGEASLETGITVTGAITPKPAPEKTAVLQNQRALASSPWRSSPFCFPACMVPRPRHSCRRPPLKRQRRHLRCAHPYLLSL